MRGAASAADAALAQPPTQLAVCLTGTLRWFALTTGSFKALLLDHLDAKSWRLFYVGADEPSLHGAALRMLEHIGADRRDMCTYDANVSWVWGPGVLGDPAGPFERHNATACNSLLSPMQLQFDVRWLPIFRRCLRSVRGGRPHARPPGMDASDAYNRTRAVPCTAGVSLIMQAWQGLQSLRMVLAAEARSTRRHDAILRLRIDVFLFRPIVLPRPTPQQRRDVWYSLLEESCEIRNGAHEAMYDGNLQHRYRFLPDFWAYGSRAAMEVTLAAPLAMLLEFGLSAQRQMAVRPIRRQGTPKYASHPVPAALAKHFNESRHCLPHRQRVGLLRINTVARCFTVQARIGDRPATWQELTLNETGRHDRWLGEDATMWMPAVAKLYHKCFGLVSNRSCPRTVGDRNLFHGAEAACLRTGGAVPGCSEGGALPVVATAEVSNGHSDPDAQHRVGFRCIVNGLRMLQRTGLAPRPKSLPSTRLGSRSSRHDKHSSAQ